MLLLINSKTIEDVQLSEGVLFYAAGQQYTVNGELAEVIEVIMESGRDHHKSRVTAFMLPDKTNAAYQRAATVLADVAQALSSHIAASLFNLLNIGRRSADLHEVIKEFMGKLTQDDLAMVDYAHTLAHDMYNATLLHQLGVSTEKEAEHEQGSTAKENEERGETQG